jgi:hypothetical protein
MSRTQLEIFKSLRLQGLNLISIYPNMSYIFTDDILLKNSAVLEKLTKAAAGRGWGGVGWGRAGLKKRLNVGL